MDVTVLRAGTPPSLASTRRWTELLFMKVLIGLLVKTDPVRQSVSIDQLYSKYISNLLFIHFTHSTTQVLYRTTNMQHKHPVPRTNTDPPAMLPAQQLKDQVSM